MLEHWTRREEIHGVAGGLTVPFLWATRLEFKFIWGGQKVGNRLRARSNVVSSGSTNAWYPIILGGQALDCAERDGMGIVPGPNSYHLTGLGSDVERTEHQFKSITSGVFAQQTFCCTYQSVMDSGHKESTKQAAGLLYQTESLWLLDPMKVRGYL